VLFGQRCEKSTHAFFDNIQEKHTFFDNIPENHTDETADGWPAKLKTAGQPKNGR
jgi:hypothetical protein